MNRSYVRFRAFARVPTRFLALCGLLTIAATRACLVAAEPPPPIDLQAALDASPGRVVVVPEGTHALTQALVIRHPGSGLSGMGRLLQRNTNAPFLEIRGVKDVRIRDLTLVRPEDGQDVRPPAVVVEHAEDVSLEGVRIQDHRSAAGVIRVEDSRRIDLVRCDIRNYMTLAIDDRTASPHYGYAFHCIDGTGILVNRCRDVLIQGNRVVEERLRPTRELKERHRLGEFSGRAARKGSLISAATWDAGYVNNWHQGSAIVVTGPEDSAFIRILGNHVENAAQGIDLHADFVTVSGNVVVNAFMGMKAMHGSRQVVIAHNQFVRNDLWSIGLMPGTAAHPALPGTNGAPARPANHDGGSIITGNVIAEFGRGDSHWIWDPQRHTCAPLVFDRGQEPDDPPLRDVVVSDNVVADAADERLAGPDGEPRPEPARYRWAVFVNPGGPNAPQRLHFHCNLFPPGTQGISNVPLEP